jgi:hypothetical protein
MDNTNIHQELKDNAPNLASLYSDLECKIPAPDYFSILQNEVLHKLNFGSATDTEKIEIPESLHRDVISIDAKYRKEEYKGRLFKLIPGKTLRYAAIFLVLIISGVVVRNYLSHADAYLIGDEEMISFIDHYATEQDLLWLMDEDWEIGFLSGIADDLLLEEYSQYEKIDSELVDYIE